MAENKTKPTKDSVTDYLNSLETNVRTEARVLLKIFKETTGMKPVMWGSMVGFGSYHYKYDSGREGDFFATGFAMRTTGPVIYIMPGYQDYGSLMKKLGPHKLGKSCLYLKSLQGIEVKILKQLIKAGLRDLKKHYPVSKT